MKNNFKIYFLRVLLLIELMTVWLANSQTLNNNNVSNSLENHTASLERFYNAHSQLLTQIQKQLIDNQNDIDLLRGQIQENQYQINRIIKQQEQIYKQISKTSNFANNALTEHNDLSVNNQKFQTSEVPITNVTDNSIDAKNDYNKALMLMLEKNQYDQAINAFQDFVQRYPNSTYQPNANYWLGLINYNQGKKDNAAYFFAIVAKKYSKSPKAPDSLLKLGFIMQDKGQINKARTIYQQIVKLYPSTEAAKQAQKRLLNL